MKNTLKILLFSTPAVIGSFFLNLMSKEPAQALELDSQSILKKHQLTPQVNLNCDRNSSVTEGVTCTANKYLLAFEEIINNNDSQEYQQFPNVQRDENGDLLLNVSEEESDAAVAMFGCDCVKAINALRQLRGIPIGVEGDRILPGPMIRPCTQRLPEA